MAANGRYECDWVKHKKINIKISKWLFLNDRIIVASTCKRSIQFVLPLHNLENCVSVMTKMMRLYSSIL